MTLAGCPLDEKISEMHTLRAAGHVLGAFATIAIDNPMMAATGHRICNDCMKACIYQKQEPVDIPQAETQRPEGCAGAALGFRDLRAADALESAGHPPPAAAPGQRPEGADRRPGAGRVHAGASSDERRPHGRRGRWAEDRAAGFDVSAPVRDVETLFENLDDRVMAGFGGVAEYGITVRWNKNYLKLVRLLLERRASRFAHFGGIRFGGGATLSIDDAWAMGFDHIALCMGAGQADGARHPERAGARRAAGLRLPDGAATDRRGEAVLHRQSAAAPAGGGDRRRADGDRYRDRKPRLLRPAGGEIRPALPHAGGGARRDRRCALRWTPEEAEIADEFLAHAAAIRAEREAAAAEGRSPALAALLDSWGGATIAYRRRLIDSPSYTLNHEEVAKAMEEAVRFAEGLTPRRGGNRRVRPCRGAAGEARRWDRGGAAGARHPGRRRHAAQHRAGAGGRPHPAGWPLFPGGG